ncbi:MAG: response regulator transcription factor [Akkermansiaceae bacterium]|jgi:DNA-binding response OmpR family regulator|nr:response regulator transcription factor [Akkermansiaceae bacterium]MDB4466388.1 response regulator transcription factor [bacterium]MDF1712413.1 response regulator transcription factor [Akkermansiaceae bacterium]
MKILVTEDEPMTLEALGELLRMEGFDVVEASGGEMALKLWEEVHPDLVCLDIMMPGMDGYEVCRRLREKDSRTPILFLSAKNEEKDIVAGLELGADDFIRKPFSTGEVMARIKSALRRAYPEKGSRKIQMADVVVWPDELRAEQNGSGIELTLREVKMLLLLEEKKGLPVSRDEFLDRCWGMDYFPDSRTLDQHVHMLRKKIEGGSELIETVRGVGYRFRG